MSAGSSSPSLFDDDEERRSHQRNASKSLLFTTSEKQAAAVAVNASCTGVSQPSPVLCRVLGVDAVSGQKKCVMNVDDWQQPMLSASPNFQSTVSDVGEGAEVKRKDSCIEYAVKFTHSTTSNALLQHDELDAAQANTAATVDDQPTLDVLNNGDVTDMSALSVSNDELNVHLSDIAKQPQHNVTTQLSGYKLPLPKKRRCKPPDSRQLLHTPPCAAVIIDNSAENTGKLFSVVIFHMA